jgi:outer membrane protein assembly factor BamD
LDELRAKLSFKAYRSAKLYFNMGEYKSAIVSLKNIARDYPEMVQKEEVDFLIVKSNFLLAQNSISEKQLERYKNTLNACEELSELYTEGSKYMKEAKEIAIKSQLAIKKLENKN